MDFVIRHKVSALNIETMKGFGDAASSYLAPSQWNNRPEGSRGADSVHIFKHLKQLLWAVV